MKNEVINKIVLLTLIAGRKQKDEILTELSKAGVHLITIMYGKGTVHANYLMNVLGLIPEENKIVITCVLLRENTDEVFRILTEKLHFDKPNTGIAFTTPIGKLSY